MSAKQEEPRDPTPEEIAAWRPHLSEKYADLYERVRVRRVVTPEDSDFFRIRDEWHAAMKKRLQRQLSDAVDIATTSRLQTVLKVLFKTSSVAEQASKMLLVPEEEAFERERRPVKPRKESKNSEPSKCEKKDQQPKPEGPDMKTSPILELVAGNKRLRPKYTTCEQCEQEFDVTENYDGDCVWHYGELEVDTDADIWIDHDEETHGHIDRDDLREQFPEGFMLNCCDADGTKPGCQKTAHTEQSCFFSKRPRYD